MATSQHAFHPDGDSVQPLAKIHAHPTAIDLEHISISQLLGRDYIFINNQAVQLPLASPALLHALLDELIQRLDLTEAHAVAISIEESPAGALSFVRHDLSWHNHKISKVESTAINHPEQQEFMEMIWRCSSAATNL